MRLLGRAALSQVAYPYDRLRHEKDPYLGFMDCAKRIIDEEGWQTFYRAWWVTVLAAIVSAAAAASQYQGNVIGSD